MGCGSESGDDGGDDASAAPAPATELTITFWPQGQDGPAQKATLTCDPPGGTHPAPEQACVALDANAEALQPVPPDAICTELYGGPEEAEVRGTFDGEAIEATFSRQNGCEIDRWDRLEPLLRLADS